MRPVDIDENNASELWNRIYGPIVRDYGSKLADDVTLYEKVLKFTNGDSVRISRAKPIFEKGYLPTFSDEIFKIVQVSNSTPPYFELVDHENEPIRGRFYAEELCKTTEDTTYRIESVIKKRTKNGKRELLVKFIGYKQNYWISDTDIV
jgi:hypothetical protein